MVRVTNTTCSFALGRRISLKRLVRRECGVRKARTKHFARVTWSLRRYGLGCTALIYASGRIVLVGADTLRKNLAAALFLALRLRAAAHAPSRPVVSNYVGAHRFASPINLAQLYEFLRERNPCRFFGTFEPETFPALCYLTRAGAKATVFHTGQVIFSACRTLAQLIAAYREVSLLVNDCFK